MRTQALEKNAPKASVMLLLRKESAAMAKEFKELIGVFKQEKTTDSKDFQIEATTMSNEPVLLSGKSFATNKGLKVLNAGIVADIMFENGVIHGAPELMVRIDPLTKEGKMSETDFIFAIPEQSRGKGIGSALIAYELQWAFDEGAEKVTFSTTPRFAQRLHNSFGAEIHEDPKSRAMHPDDEQVFWNVIFTKESVPLAKKYLSIVNPTNIPSASG